ncbi:MAG: 4Fe-4S binding protein [Solirubrobacteraceae bacterium]|nr:4Fe-4S binding protein [Solirubrobacteraceae bacterium]
MPHAVTQSCVGDGSCVYACPVNCIQPTPDDPAFELAEMLFIDPATCVDCGACLTACPVDAIKPARDLEPSEVAFLEINAAYHEARDARRKRPSLAPVPPRLRVRDFGPGSALDVAIVGSGPAAMYAADELLTIPGARVTVYERLDRPYGLVRSGVAPDHRRTRRVTRQLDRIREHPRLSMRLGVEIGRDLTHEQLMERHHGVIYAIGALSDRRLQIPGAELPGVASATEFVGWYNGHPDYADRAFDLSHRRAIVVGNGNVALDVARILTVDPESLVDTEIAPHALAALRASKVEEVVVVGRRGPEHSSFTLPELIGLSATEGVTLAVDPADLPAEIPHGDAKLELLQGLASRPRLGRTIHLRYGLTPVAIHGFQEVDGLELQPTFDASTRATTLGAGLVLTAIGYRGLAVPGVPFDEVTGTVPNDAGRVCDPQGGAPVAGTYVTGWIKRGPTGFIGTNKRCAQETVRTLVDDHNAGLLRTAAATT